jgi:16S rRNA (guanine527-N7)-methyltransferase
MVRLERYVALLEKWQRADNLVSPRTLPEIWERHIADSAQLHALFPAARRWLDFGSGAGLPGLVTAILLADIPGTVVHLVESNRRKCAFLRQAARLAGAPTVIHEGRIEAVLTGWSEPVDMVSARALAPLGELLALSRGVLVAGRRAAFHKGRDFRREVAEASQSWSFDLVEHPSRIGDGGVILEISGLSRRNRDRS